MYTPVVGSLYCAVAKEMGVEALKCVVRKDRSLARNWSLVSLVLNIYSLQVVLLYFTFPYTTHTGATFP